MSRDDEGPVPSQQPLAVDFLENRQLHYRMDSNEIPCKYDTQRQQFVDRGTRVVIADASEELLQRKLALVTTKASFRKAVTSLQEKHAKKESKSKKADAIIIFDFDAVRDWHDVVEAVQNAVTEYGKDESPGGKFRKACRRVGEHAQSMKAFVGLLPEGEYKTLCGGLTLILTAMESHREVRDKMGDLFDSIPEFVSDCEDYMAMYPRQTTLRVHVDDIYISMLSALEDMLRWYKQPSRVRVTGSLFKNSRYAQSIDAHLKRINASKALFESETKKFLHWHAIYTSHGVEVANKAINYVGAQLIEANKSISSVEHGVRQLNATATHGNEKLNAMQGDIEAAAAGITQSNVDLKDVKSILNYMTGVLSDVAKNAKWHGQIEKEIKRLQALQVENIELSKKKAEIESENESLRAKLADNIITPESLIELLKLDPDLSKPTPEAQVIQGIGVNESLSFQSRSKWITEEPGFQKWMSSKRSTALCVQGHGGMEKVSPLSFLVSLLHQQLSQSKRNLVLTFFCGMHAVSPFDTKTRAPLMIAQSILRQLLTQPSIDWGTGADELPLLSFLNRKTKTQLQEESFGAYRRVIKTLLTALGGYYDAVFIMVDGIEFCESNWEDDIVKLIESMAGTAVTFNEERKDGKYCTLKVLFTAGSYSRTFAWSGAEVTTIHMPEDIEKDGDGFVAL